MKRTVLPFSAIVGQDGAKLALRMNAIDPLIGGVLIRGHRGTGKTTLARALGSILPMQRVVAGCPFRCDPDDPGAMCDQCRSRAGRGPGPPVATERMRVVELPVSASLDRVVGGIDVTAALRSGVTRFSPGILAAANRNILYVDEVNLAGDAVVDALLDAAASGVNTVEREGISVAHPARFALVGTMNEQEGQLRPQLLDRFGLCADLAGSGDLDERAEIAERDAAFRAGDPVFGAEYEAADLELARSITMARAQLGGVTASADLVRLICQTCVNAHVVGHRADIVMYHAVMALAAAQGRRRPTPADVQAVAVLALAHRGRRPVERPGPTAATPGSADQRDTGTGRADAQVRPAGPTGPGSPDEPSPDGRAGNAGRGSADGAAAPGSRADARPAQGGGTALDGADGGDGAQHVTRPGRSGPGVPLVELPRSPRPRAASGRRMLSEAADGRGRYVAARLQEPVTDVAIDATLRAAAPHQLGRGWRPGEPLRLRRGDLRQKIREHKVGSLVVFIVDASASMAARQRMEMTKAVILALLRDAYVRRDRVAAVAFGGRSARVTLPPTSSVLAAERQLAELPVGGSTPLPHGLLTGYQLIRREQRLDVSLRPLIVLVTDGYPNVSLGTRDPYSESLMLADQIRRDGIGALVVDSGHRAAADASVPMYEDLRPAVCRPLADRMGAAYFVMPHASAAQLRHLVVRLRARRASGAVRG
jgi:magnesium chelatase subunit D